MREPKEVSMGMFNNLFKQTPDYPALDDHSPAAQRIHEVEDALKELAHDVSDPLEVVPSEHAAYVFLGKPPKRFGLAWIHDGKVTGLNTLVQEHGVSPAEIEKVLDELREAYKRHMDEAHFTTKVENRTVVVTPSQGLEKEVHDIVEQIAH
jgi:hypothetical protein